MRKELLIISLLLLVLPVSLHARARGHKQADNYHFGYVSTSLGYTSISQDINTVTTTGNLGYLVGAGYEFRRTSFWLSVGAQFMQEESKTALDVYSFQPDYKGLDDQGKNIEYYRYTIHQTDKQVWRTIDVPLMLGFYYNGFYVGAGAKVGFSVGSTITVNGGYDLSAKYERYEEEFKNINYYRTYELPQTTFDCTLRPQFSVIGEIGYDLLSFLNSNKPTCHLLKLGVYFEYGLRSVHPQESMDNIYFDGKSIEQAAKEGKDVRNATLNPFYLSAATADKRIVPYFVGAKITYMIGGNRYATGTWHKGCQCYQ